MVCRFVKTIFQNKENGFCVFVYHTSDDTVPLAARNTCYKGEDIEFTAVGKYLPDTDSVEVDMQGKWVKGKRGTQLEGENFEEILPQTEEGILSYLSSGMVKGIGPRTAELIVKRFGKRTFDVLDHYPDSLLEIRGISQKKLDTILLSYQGGRAMRDLASYLTPFKITPRKIQKIYENFGADALETVKKQPFSLCQINGFGFLTVDEIAKANKCRPNDPMRIEGCIHYCFEQETQNGHLYVNKQNFQKAVYEQLNQGYSKEAVTEREVYNVIYKMFSQNELYYEEGALYLARFYGFECGAAKRLVSLLMKKDTGNRRVELLVEDAQKELGILLSEKQIEAVKKAFCHKVSIITGGPGTGKTTVQKVLLYINEKIGGGNVLLTAPTGRASRRMAESTGFPESFTMHSVLGLTNDEESEGIEEMLDADFIIADEFTMSDMSLSFQFFNHIKPGTRLILVGDVNQLPSVGPGNVFRELVQCGVIPVTVLDMVFRQKENSRIAMNAQRMLQNNATLDYGTDFVFREANSAAEASELIQKIYKDAVGRLGTDNVQVLSPYRKKGDVSTNALNEVLWDLVNPEISPEVGKNEKLEAFRIGDKIIHNKNKNGISNGDIGYVTDIFTDEDGVVLTRLEFSEHRNVEYNSDELDMVEHSYATTVHKSQGSEYRMVILPWLPMFYKMLRRDILYTAITRAKEQVVIVGSKKAIYMAIHNTDSDKRNTRLGERVVREFYAAQERERKEAV
mgnify:CR=1 FL=1